METKSIRDMSISEFVDTFTIIDKETIRIAMSMPKSVPQSILRPLTPIAVGKFKGDGLPENWSVNSHFIIGNVYPIYENENGDFAISTTNGIGMSITPKAWIIRNI